VYVVTWLGAAVLLFDHRLVLARSGAGRKSYILSRLRSLRSNRWLAHAGLAVVFFFAVVIFFYAPRARGTPDPGLWKAFANPGMFPAVIEEATVGSWEKFVGKWGEGNQTSYLDTFEALGRVLWEGAALTLGFAGVGFLLDRYRRDCPRDLVAFTSYWGFVTVLGYPVIVENAFPWEVVHAVVPLAVPAAVGLAALASLAIDASADDDDDE
jgi:uncharacterized protein (TIGR03663 family)